MIHIVISIIFLLEFQTNIQVSGCGMIIACSYNNTPEQLRVALLTNNSVTVSWRTRGKPDGSDDTVTPQVKYGTNETLAEGKIVTGTSATYTKFGIISWFHDVVLIVNHSTRYFYQILPANCVNASTIHSFKSQPAFGDPSPINITLVSNLGVSLAAQLKDDLDDTVSALSKMSSLTSLFLHIGGFAWADNHLLANISNTYERTWNQFQNRMQPITSGNIYMTAPGSHEVTCVKTYDCICDRNIDRNITSQYRNFSSYLHRFSMPGGDSDQTYKNLWYSFDWGLAHIVVINTETDFGDAPSGPSMPLNGGNFRPDDTQVNWLRDDLDRADKRRCQVPWIIVLGHRTWFGTNPKNSFIDPFRRIKCDSCKRAFADIIYDKVDFYFSGYMQWYQRLYPVTKEGDLLTKSYDEPKSPIYITVGTGAPIESMDSSSIPKPETAKISPEKGFSQLQLINSSVAKLYFYQSANLTQLDNVTVTRTHKCPATCSN